jgi:hypothetical protein
MAVAIVTATLRYCIAARCMTWQAAVLSACEEMSVRLPSKYV